ncbi:MFS transporter [Curvivirga aplysinae]|uniref:MFS transporter n=1 Tax=Curvivirga aplysinae TaxID=2529852 RepID=UPI0012BB5399|nr:MFS transporter [Curvivirga aplysinae]MTI10982.1 MFS transporter [Curvivirga aplysinae]
MSRRFFFSLYFLAILFHSGAYGMILLMPVLLESINATEADAGRLQLVAGISTIAIVIVSGKIVDKVGRMGSFAFSGLLLFGGLGFYGLLESISVLSIIASLLFGAGWGLFFSTKVMVLSQICWPEERVKLFSIDLVVFMIGFGISPVIGRFLYKAGLSYADVYWVMGIVCLFSSALFLFLKKPLNKLKKTGNLNTAMVLNLTSFVQVLRSPSMIPILITLLMASMYVGLNNFQAKWAQANELSYADFFIVYTIAVLASRFVMMRYKISAFSYFHIGALFIVAMGGAFGMIYMQGSWEIYMISAFLGGVGLGGMTPIIQGITANQSDQENLAQTMQVMVLAHLTGLFGFPYIGGEIIVHSGFDQFHMTAIYLGVGACVLCVIGYLQSGSFKQKQV